MMLVDAFLVVAMLFFLFLPITDRRTVQMKLCVFIVLGAALAVSVTRPHAPAMRLAGVTSSR